jgi:CPA2 family monovalent cation:H+ antiporter-2
MHDLALLQVLILLAASVVGVAAFRRFKLPAVLAYLVVGTAVGPHGLGLIPDSPATRFLAEFGVVFLLFTVGLEFSFPQLLAMRREVFGLGGLQVVVTTIAVMLAVAALGASWGGAFAVGGALAMSSTALVIRQLSEQLELNSRHGRLSVGILLFQDLAVVPFLIVLPTLSGGIETGTGSELLWALSKGFLVSALMLAFGHWLLRPIFREVASAHSAELFTLMVLLFSLAAAWGTHLAGLSLALGAFLAGMMLGETEYRHQVEADIRPFRDVLLGLFFITIGMLLNVEFLLTHLHWVLLVVAATIVFKTVSITLMCTAFGIERAIALRTGIALAQGGEFGLALLALASDDALLGPHVFQVVLAAMILTMAISPGLIRCNGAIAKRLFSRSYRTSRGNLREEIAEGTAGLSGHVIIAGYGRIGQNIARFLEQEQFAYMALDLDPIRVQEARAAGEHVYYGDSTHPEVLEAAGLRRARILVISLDDPYAAMKILPQARGIRPDIPVLVRTRDDTFLDRLQQEGATEVVPETLEASLMLVAHLLFLLNVPVSRILFHLQHVRNHRYQVLREIFHGQDALDATQGPLGRERLHSVTLLPGAYAVGRSPSELRFDEMQTQLTAVRRGDDRDTQPRQDMLLQAGDVLVLYGSPEALERAESRVLKG